MPIWPPVRCSYRKPRLLTSRSGQMDAFTDALQSLRFRDFKPGLSERRPPWGTQYPPKAWDVIFYAIQGAPCWLTVDGIEPVRITDNSICILPHGHAHALRDSLDTVPLPVRRVRPEGYYGLMRYGGEDGPLTKVYFGSFRLDHHGRNPLWDALPPYVHVKLREKPSWLDALFFWFQEEMTHKNAGHASVCSRIGELLIIQSIRIYIERLAEDPPNFLAVLHDPQLLRVLDLLHSQSEYPWTLRRLATEAGMSRSRLAERFSACLGEGPIHYLTNWRIRKAALMLAETEEKISIIVQSVGFRSEPSFNIAFKRRYGLPPGRYRRLYREKLNHPEAV